ncbi:MAG: MarR family transcriptional regulator [Melioribacteraceae bacterium]|nr:MarR family transcriptional regulator [Melioribacteraceae bacterium]MCF8353006.1 MarR family transcriptional regulator [Melioribacteraceae bacterium]MCF8392897.1 MarR family transcriptional regulator [Melioribacteraceae bacterium]MCF8417809.1 MarR family transcriptional regulator [Melioribacteraceae bacterium]
MRIEDEIKQKSFKDEYHKLAINLMYSNGWLLNYQSEILRPYSLTDHQYNVLRILRGQYPDAISIMDLKDRMLDKSSDASRLVERLRVKDLVEREICKSDRRKVDVKITQHGLDILEKTDYLDEEFKKVLNNLSIEEAKQMNDLLDKMRD